VKACSAEAVGGVVFGVKDAAQVADWRLRSKVRTGY
jgi:hypothetical protein